MERQRTRCRKCARQARHAERLKRWEAERNAETERRCGELDDTFAEMPEKAWHSAQEREEVLRCAVTVANLNIPPLERPRVFSSIEEYREWFMKRIETDCAGYDAMLRALLELYLTKPERTDMH
jgi:hypothetical protein